MKKIIAITSALAMMLALASCSGDSADASSQAASSTAPVSTAPTSTISVPTPSEPPVIEEDNNLAHADNATAVDMNTGKTAEDEGYVAYYDAVKILDKAFDGSYSGEGWQPKATEENLGAYKEGETEIPEGAYVADDGNMYKKQVWDDGVLWLGVTFEEAVSVDSVVVVWENGSIADTIENGGFRLEYTTDGTEWVTLEATVERSEDAVPSSGCISDTATFEAMDIKGVRAVILKGTTKYAPKVWEFEVYGPEAEEETESAADETTAE